ncbi:Uncharacterized membrane protein YhfC [Clostridium cavendishii DSM 21758]|uniref:Uncharacterized membrane protein YhfC n=1 Tax=Clostridium cavendishii DSM 21758 TaxID=1121302 RepID=A0A1M6EBT0_9CLOT|nr:YhfC family intramembrane metalloprotease [Clostridium cavendishii]SHI82932.1 Uncharacterized membrane protein YhfC [Clostridium cavendishii DSM 21758]
MVNQSIIITMIVATVISILLPITLMLYWKRKEKFQIKTFFLGMLGFFLFAMILERILHTVVISTKVIPVNTIYFAIYGALAAGVFEEVGRFVIFKFFLKNNREWKDGLGYGLGHAGIEMILLGGLTFVNYIVVALAINSDKLDKLLQGQNAEAVTNLKNTILNLTAPEIAMGIGERILALVLQLAFSFIVLYAIRERKNIYLLIAILVHALVDFVPALYQMNLISNIYFVEGIVFIFSILAFIFVIKSKAIYRNNKQLGI